MPAQFRAEGFHLTTQLEYIDQVTQPMGFQVRVTTPGQFEGIEPRPKPVGREDPQKAPFGTGSVTDENRTTQTRSDLRP